MKKSGTWYGFGTYWIKTSDSGKLWAQRSALNACNQVLDKHNLLIDLKLNHLGVINIWPCLENASLCWRQPALPGVSWYDEDNRSEKATMSGREGSPYQWKPQEFRQAERNEENCFWQSVIGELSWPQGECSVICCGFTHIKLLCGCGMASLQWICSTVFLYYSHQFTSSDL